jgi:hypothetical protein
MAQSLESARNKEQHLASLDDDALMKEWEEVGERAQRDRELLKMYSKEHQKRTRLAQLNLEPGDAALLQEAAARGIESQEKVN